VMSGLGYQSYIVSAGDVGSGVAEALAVRAPHRVLALHHRLALDALAKRLPDATRIEPNGIGHLAADDRGRPEEVARVVGDFLAG
jgi:hypothetical protein